MIPASEIGDDVFGENKKKIYKNVRCMEYKF